MHRLRFGASKDVAIGFMLCAVGAVGHLLAGSLPRGGLMRMGPGFLPSSLSVILLGFGAVILVRGLRSGASRVEPWAWRPLLLVLASVATFIAAMAHLGFVAAIVATVLVAAAASPETRPRQAMVLAALLSGACAVIFVVALKLPFPLWPGGR